MADEGQGSRRRRSRGRRRGRQDAHHDEPGQEQSPEEGGSEADVSSEDLSPGDLITSESAVPGVTGEMPTVNVEPEKPKKRERGAAAAGAAGAAGSPMDFWRSGQARSARASRPTSSGPPTPKNLWQRITSAYLPPWVPVVGVMVVVFGILGALFVVRSATGAPRIGEDHWHATYSYWVCGEKQAPAPTWSGGVHTHGDSVVHIHPHSQGEEGAGARLTKWFEYGGGKLDGDEVRLPGSSTTYKNGDACGDGTPNAGATGEVQVFVGGQKIDYGDYIPQDGDIIRIVFGPVEEVTQLDDRTIIEDEPTRDVSVTVDQPDDADESSTEFTPSTINVDAGEVVRINVTNADAVSHGMRILGYDDIPGTADDFVVVPDGEDPADPAFGGLLQPGQSGFVVIRFDDPAVINFHDPTVTSATGTIPVADVQVTPTPGPEEDFDEEVEVKMNADGFAPSEITVAAGTRVKLNLVNEGTLAHNMRIAGPDGEFFTDDDVSSADVLPGNTGELFVELEAGTYEFWDDFNRDNVGTLTVE